MGTRLSASTAIAGTGDLPTTLAGTSVILTDSNGLTFQASLFKVSPTQIVYRVPARIGPGRGIAVVTGNRQVNAVAIVNIEPTSPGLFTLPGGSQAAATLQRVKSDGTQTSETVAGPIDLGPSTDQVFLVLYGTGISGAQPIRRYSTALTDRASQVTSAGSPDRFLRSRSSEPAAGSQSDRPRPN